MSYEKERAKERIHHTYQSVDLVLSHVGVLILIFVAVGLLKMYRPSFDTVGLIVALSVGAVLGVVSLEGRRMAVKRYLRKLEEVDKMEDKPQA